METNYPVKDKLKGHMVIFRLLPARVTQACMLGHCVWKTVLGHLCLQGWGRNGPGMCSGFCFALCQKAFSQDCGSGNIGKGGYNPFQNSTKGMGGSNAM